MTKALDVWSPGWRADTITHLSTQKFEWDLVVVGGGITGAGIYREAAGRGLRVLLLEQKDFAWGTSSRSSKMVHGGLRYLAGGQFSLARDSVRERQQLMEALPGLVDPLPFLMGHYRGGFPGPWVFDKVLAIYDWMAGKRFRKFIVGGASDYWAPGIKKENLLGLTRFQDAVTDDARLVMRVLHAANREGGTALNYTTVLKLIQRSGKVEGVEFRDEITGEVVSVMAKAVVNATGAWTDTLRECLGKDKVIRPLRGSHLVVPSWRLPVAFTVSFFHPKDKRPVFVFPWEGVSVIGTTDLDHRSGLNNEASINEEEAVYLLDAVNHQFSQAKLVLGDVISTWSGVRPVVSKRKGGTIDLTAENNPSDENREHVIWNDNGLVSVAGGKLTTYRLIALDVLRQLMTVIPEKLTEDSLAEPLPFELRSASLSAGKRKLSKRAALRLAGRYGPDAESVAACIDEGSSTGSERISWTDTLWSELVWACESESVEHLDDLLLRRTRIGLLLEQGGQAQFSRIREICERYLGWSAERWQQECERYLDTIATYYAVPSTSGEAKEVV
jgi:glycerol-3-phosphate dehydrogenase